MREYLNEHIDEPIDVKNILIKRIPFIKEYNVFRDPKDKKRLEAQRVVVNQDVKMKWNDDFIEFPQFTVSSKIYYYAHKIDNYTFHNFIIKNDFIVIPPKEMDDLTFKVFNIYMNMVEKKLSYSKELLVYDNEEFPKEELDKIINEMNGVLFMIEEFTKKHYIDLF
jgi:hypothetical protein